MHVSRIAALLTIAALVAGGVWWWQSGGRAQEAQASEILPHQVDVTVPTLSEVAQAGSTVFAANCQACHGVNASGGPGGPPLVHIIYEPNHHGDGSFVAAIRNGVRQHHWRFGNMAPVAGISDPQVREIITYVRELQRANGIN